MDAGPEVRLCHARAGAALSAVAVVGLGAMGGRMARRLLEAGHELVVWNRSRERTAGFDRVAGTPAEAAAAAEVTLVVVADPEALRDVTEGPAGVAAASSDVLQMSTVSPAAIERLAGVLPRERLLDAPVLGSLSEAETGTLTVFAGGDEALVDRWRPLLSALGRVLHVGPLGSGTAAKLVANSTLFGVLGVLGEALALADRLGLERDAVFEVLAATPVAAQAERRRASVESGEFPLRFALALARKDADLIAGAAAGADLRLAAAARAWITEAEAAGWGDRDYSALLEWIVRPRTS